MLARIERASERALLGAVVALAAVVRALYFATSSGGTWATPLLDADTNLQVAQQLAAGPLPEPYWQPPLYPWLLSLSLRFSPSLWPPRLLAAALSCGTAAMAFALARAARTSRAAALLAGALVALHGPLLYHDGDLLPASLGTFLATLPLWASLRLPDSLGRAAAAGASVGLATLAVGPLALLAPVLALRTERRGAGRLDYAAAVLAGMLVVLAPVIRHNRQTGGGTVVALSGGINLWIGNNPRMNELVAVRPGASWEALASEPARLGHVQSPQAYDEYFARKARAFCLASPAACARNLLDKARQLASSIEIPRNESLYAVREQSPVLAALTFRVGSFGFPWALLFPLAAVGLASVWNVPTERDPASPPQDAPPLPSAGVLRWLALALLALALGPLIFFVTGRYRLPLVPLVAVFAAVGVEALRRRPKAPLATAALVALMLALWPLNLPVERINYRAEMSYLTAGAHQRKGDLEATRLALESALREQPDHLEAAVNLGLLHAQQGRPDEARRWLTQALQHHPDDPVARQALRSLER